MDTNKTELISLRGLSRVTGFSIDEIRRLRDEEHMPVYRIGKRRQLVILSEWWEWFRAHKLTA